MVAAVFLDRDNTLIHNDGDLGDPAAVRLIKGAASAIASLRGLSYKIVVVTNQGGVARGAFGESDVQAVHERIAQLVKANSGSSIDRFYYCPYHPEGKLTKYRREHPWRKPQPGMLLAAAEDLKLDLSRSWLIGDQMRDIQAAAAAGVRAVLLTKDAQSTGSSPSNEPAAEPEPASKDDGKAPPYWVAPTIIEAVKIIAQKGRTEQPAPDATSSAASRRRSRTPHTAETRRDEKATKRSARQDPPDTATRTPPPARPFRPWMTQPADDAPAHDAPADDAPADTPQPAGTPPPGPADSTGEPKTPPAVTTPATGRVDPAVHDQILRQILQELRSQRGADSEFSFHHMIAIVLQMIAAVCLLGALWMGSANLDLFVRWLGVALGIELATIAMLLFRR